MLLFPKIKKAVLVALPCTLEKNQMCLSKGFLSLGRSHKEDHVSPSSMDQHLHWVQSMSAKLWIRKAHCSDLCRQGWSRHLRQQSMGHPLLSTCLPPLLPLPPPLPEFRGNKEMERRIEQWATVLESKSWHITRLGAALGMMPLVPGDLELDLYVRNDKDKICSSWPLLCVHCRTNLIQLSSHNAALK